MRHHDIERLKEAARRYAANKYTVGDMEELSEFACNALFEPPCSEKIRKVDNGDGTVTIHGLSVVVPVGLIPDGQTPVEVRSRKVIPTYASGKLLPMGVSATGSVELVCGSPLHAGDLRILLADKTQPGTWTPPASLPDGEYRWDGESFEQNTGMWSANKHLTLPLLFADWTDPPRAGRYRKTGNVATWIGE